MVFRTANAWKCLYNYVLAFVFNHASYRDVSFALAYVENSRPSDSPRISKDPNSTRYAPLGILRTYEQEVQA